VSIQRKARRRKTGPGAITTIADALFSKTQQRVLGLLFGQPERSFAITELITLAAIGSGGVQREVQRLQSSGLIEAVPFGHDRKYRANQRTPVFGELRGIVDKTSGVPSILTSALAPLADRMRLAILFGSVAKHSDTAMSDIDVLVVSDELTLEEVFEALAPAERQLGRTVSPTMYKSSEFRRGRDSNPFLKKVLAGKHVVLVGDVDAVASTG
jgi:predicted nucleotidyltransferase